MRLDKFAAKALLFALVAVTAVSAQQAEMKKKFDPNHTIVPASSLMQDLPVVGKSDLYCAGYVQTEPISTSTEVVGAENEKDQYIYFEGNLLYINSGASNGVSEGDMFSVVRPRGKVHTEWTNKSSLGFYVEEVGAVEVERVMNDVSLVRVKTSCSSIRLGDLLVPTPKRTSPMFKYRGSFDRFAPSSGKANGRIFMARDLQEVLGQNNVVYVDLGAEDGVSFGDILTVYRPLGTGNIYRKSWDVTVDNREDGYESRRYKGGHFSNQAPRKEGSEATGDLISPQEAKSRRPAGLRRVVGELLIINVKEKTATAVVVRSSSEIHTGDMVEVK